MSLDPVIAAAARRARVIPHIQDPQMRRQMAHRVCFDLIWALKHPATTTAAKKERR